MKYPPKMFKTLKWCLNMIWLPMFAKDIFFWMSYLLSYSKMIASCMKLLFPNSCVVFSSRLLSSNKNEIPYALLLWYTLKWKLGQFHVIHWRVLSAVTTDGHRTEWILNKVIYWNGNRFLTFKNMFIGVLVVSIQ